MERISIRFPSEEEEERARRFQVHKQYLRAIADFLEDRYTRDYSVPLPAGVLAAQRELSGYQRIQRQPPRQGREIRRYLGIAWASEVQLRMALRSERSLLRYSNVWAPVHAYYAVYMAMQAWFASMNLTGIVDDHSASLRTLSANNGSRELLPLPWSVGCSGCPQLNEGGFSRLPEGVNPRAHVELLSNPSPETFWPRYCKMLETTRARRLDQRFDKWKRANDRRAIRANEKRAIASRLWDTTVFDFLFRLRVRSNYREVETFLLAAVGEVWQDEFLRALVRLTGLTTLLFESLLVRQVGPTLYGQTLDDFLAHDVAGVTAPSGFLTRRRNLLLG